jgi:hypothetical protein
MTMKKTLLTLIATVLTAGAAHAAEWQDTPDINQAKSTKTRAEVVAELVAARKAGEVPAASELGPVVPAKSTKTRAEVRAELEAYIKSGQRDRDAQKYAGGPN